MILVLAMAATACGGDDDGDENGDSNPPDASAGLVFDLTALPENFPDELVPPEWDTGAFSTLTGFPTATFESSMSFDDAVDYYDSVLGEGVVVGNDVGERLAQWTRTPPWIVSVFEGEPVTIGVTEVEDE